MSCVTHGRRGRIVETWVQGTRVGGVLLRLSFAPFVLSPFTTHLARSGGSRRVTGVFGA